MDYFDLPEPDYNKLWTKYGHLLPVCKLDSNILTEQVECSQKTVRGFSALVSKGFNRIELMRFALEIGLRVLWQGLKDTPALENVVLAEFSKTQWRIDHSDGSFDVINTKRLKDAKTMLRNKLGKKRLPNGSVWSKVKE